MDIPEFEVCKVLKSSTDNILIKQLVESINVSATNSLHQCPYNNFNFNMSAPKTQLFHTLPSGNYKVFTEVRFNGMENPVLNWTIEFDINTFRDKLG
ncbi:hypothetical protein PVAND_017852 [Polypedilum vanderplanki]|nr:hypothetical protein PVAND_017852 [Polypedilum vanderplanki]